MRLSTNAQTLVGVVVVGLLAGCGGATVASELDGGEHHDAESQDSGHRDAPLPPDDAGQPWSPVCPATAPVVGAKCASENVTCEYGPLQYDVACDTVLECESGAWSKLDTFMSCVPDAPNASACPSTLAAIPQGGACSPMGLQCAYPKGVCSCERGFGPVEIDGGEGATWTCNPEPGCPMPRPRLGSPCSGNASCTYESCGYGQSCEDGAWQGEAEACAVAG